MGNTQFMPSNVAAYGVDADKNGKLDLWDSEAGPLCPIGKINDASGGENNERAFFLPSARLTPKDTHS
jgi:membrane-bound lytic murein transglycosylase B